MEKTTFKKKSTNVLIGKTFNFLTIIADAGYYKNKIPLILCRCVCGSEIIKSAYKVRKGILKSCGCKQIELTANNNRTHGYSKTLIYGRYKTMMNRCYLPTHISYSHYGKRGIIVSDPWHTFEIFLRDMGEPPTIAHTLERVDNTKGYSKENCVWATRKENAANTTHKKIWVIFGEDFIDIHLAAKKYEVSRTTIMRWCGADKARPAAKKEGCSSRLVYGE